MIPEDPTEDQAKCLLAKLNPGSVGVKVIAQALQNAYCGFVVWDAQPLTGISYRIHKFSFVDAINTGLAFCGTDTRNEWAVLGPSALVVMRSLPPFVPCVPSIECAPFVYIGMVGFTHLYVYQREFIPPDGKLNEWCVGVADKAARGLIQNSAV